MKVHLEGLSLSHLDADVLVLPVYAQEDPAKLLASLDKGFDKAALAAWKTAAQEEGFSGKSGQQVWLPTYGAAPFKKICLYGLGKEADVNAAVYRKLGAQVSRRLAATPTPNVAAGTGSKKKGSAEKERSVCICLRDTKKLSEERALEAALECFVLASFSFLRYKTQAQDESRRNEPMSKRWTLSFKSGLSKAKFDATVKRALTISQSTNLARELIAEPPVYMTPTRLAHEARRIAKEYGLDVKVLDAAQAEKLGMGAFLGVARGAKEEPRLIVLKYNYSRSKKTIGLIGKGITFDSGGLSLKPAQSMEHMKYDMSGAASVLATMQVVGALKPKVSVLAVVAATENMPGDNALHPGDVLKSMNGKTIEVNNTDAEGRLILADAITYAIKEGVDELIDIATLTGAVVTALGRVAAGIMGSSPQMIAALMESGKSCGEQFWQLPLFDEYKEGLRSDIADLKNAGSRGEAGSSSAGMFIKEFTENLPWVHMDVAGVSWLDRDKDELNKGGTAFGVRTMSRYILSH
ncbi:MAG: leucyl aminopeptidase [Candidatus Obscuribacter sp.]|nr:leucyl aminopeptidase [Candidatus Obscuribacter sp.]MBK9282403.1 leucyl aminopeptidase [Candidatus Obscuribacter sp.]